MADECDRAEELMEVELAFRIDAARGVKPNPDVLCQECEEPLPVDRQPYGICVPCQKFLAGV